METLRVRLYIRGYHAYMDIWSPKVGDQLILRREPENVVDVNAVSVLTEMDHVVGHLPKLMARWVSKFLKRLTNHGKVVVTEMKVNRGAGVNSREITSLLISLKIKCSMKSMTW